MPDTVSTDTAQHDSVSAPHYVDDRDLARLTPISRAQWQAWRQQGGGPAWRKCGRRCIYKWADVVAFIESQPAGNK